MYYVYHSFNLQKKNIIPKLLITQKDVDRFAKEHHIPKDSPFIKHISESLKEEQEKLAQKTSNKKNNTAKGYQDIKITGFTNISYENQAYKLGTEIKFVLNDTKNEDGFSFHGIYDLTKRLTELSRLEGYISFQDIKHYLDDFFHHLDRELRAVNKTRQEWFWEIFYAQECKRIQKNETTPKKIDAEIQNRWNQTKNREAYTRNAIHAYLLSLVEPLSDESKRNPKYVEKKIANQSRKIQDAIAHALNVTSSEEQYPQTEEV